MPPREWRRITLIYLFPGDRQQTRTVFPEFQSKNGAALQFSAGAIVSFLPHDC
jgi:hypothetical protein